MRSVAELKRTFLAIDHIFFHDMCAESGVRIRWKKYRKNKNSFQFGEYDPETKVVALNERLAHADVPDYVVSAVTMHEMLHFVVGLDHNVPFSRAEHKHPFFYESEQWCDEFCLRELAVAEHS